MAPYDIIHIAKQSSQDLTVVSPPYRLLGCIFLACALIALIIAVPTAIKFRAIDNGMLRVLVWGGCALLVFPFLSLGLWLSTSETSIVLSRPERRLALRKTVIGVHVRSENYSFNEIQNIRVGVGDTCRFLYMTLRDGRKTTLFGCTDRDGYSEAAQTMIQFITNTSADPARQ